MKSARTHAQNKELTQNCQSHKFCVHQHYQKCYENRIRSIPYTLFPKQNLNAQVNVHLKCTNQAVNNFQTLAYQKYTQGKQPETQNDRNFVKNFYLQNVPEQMCMTNQIVKELQQETYPFNAYNLAEGASKDYYAFQFKRQQYLVTARRRAKNSSNMFAKKNKIQSQNAIVQRSKWIHKIIATMEDLGQRMFGLATTDKQNQSENGKQRIFLSQKSYVNQKYLKQYKIKDTETSKKIFQELRVNMLRKKKKFQDQRIQNKNTTLSTSYISQTTNQTSSVSQSMISAASEVQDGQTQEQMVEQLCNFEQLKRKWKKTDVQRIKDIILSTLARKVIFNAQSEKAKQISTYKRQCKSIPSKLKTTGGQQKGSKRSKTQIKKKVPQQKVINKSKLTIQQQDKKEKLLKSGQFDSVGQKFQKTRNFSNLFKKKQASMKLNLSFIQKDDQKSRQNIKTRNEIQTQRYGKQIELTLNQNKRMQKGYKTARTATSYLRI